MLVFIKGSITLQKKDDNTTKQTLRPSPSEPLTTSTDSSKKSILEETTALVDKIATYYLDPKIKNDHPSFTEWNSVSRPTSSHTPPTPLSSNASPVQPQSSPAIKTTTSSSVDDSIHVRTTMHASGAAHNVASSEVTSSTETTHLRAEIVRLREIIREEENRQSLIGSLLNSSLFPDVPSDAQTDLYKALYTYYLDTNISTPPKQLSSIMGIIQALQTTPERTESPIINAFELLNQIDLMLQNSSQDWREIDQDLSMLKEQIPTTNDPHPPESDTTSPVHSDSIASSQSSTPSHTSPTTPVVSPTAPLFSDPSSSTAQPSPASRTLGERFTSTFSPSQIWKSLF